MEQDYLIEYEEFVKKFRLTMVSGEEVGLVIVRMAHYFGRYNIAYQQALRQFVTVRAQIQSQADEATGKAITSSKADTLAAATMESAKLEEAKVHVQNIETYINALKALQRGVLTEYSHAA